MSVRVYCYMYEQEDAEAALSTRDNEKWPRYILSNLHSVVSGAGIQERYRHGGAGGAGV